MTIRTFTPTVFRSGSSTVFNAVQEDGEVLIRSKSRPCMILMLRSEKEAMKLKIAELSAIVKSKA